eukprot:gene7475-13249_t
MNPLGLLLALICVTSTIFYFRNMIRESRPIKRLSSLASRLKSQGYNVVGLQSNDISMKELLVAAIEVAKRGGIKVKQVRESNNLQEQSKGETAEGVNDPLTEGDLLSHQQMYYSFKNTWPDVAVVSEESGTSKVVDTAAVDQLETDGIESKLSDKMDIYVPKSDIMIWIDPLDATKEYTENLRQYVTTMVCVAVGGKAVIGVIHKPFLGETFWAWYQHGHNIPQKTDGMLHKSPRIIVSRSHAGTVNETARKAFGEDVRVVAAGGAGYKVIELAKGNVDVYLHSTKIKKWDICAGNAILTSLGGKMTSLKGADIAYDKKEDVVLTDGLLATMADHEKYFKELKSQ